MCNYSSENLSVFLSVNIYSRNIFKQMPLPWSEKYRPTTHSFCNHISPVFLHLISKEAWGALSLTVLDNSRVAKIIHDLGWLVFVCTAHLLKIVMYRLQYVQHSLAILGHSLVLFLSTLEDILVSL